VTEIREVARTPLRPSGRAVSYFDGTSNRRFRIVLMAERPALRHRRTGDQRPERHKSAHLRDRGGIMLTSVHSNPARSPTEGDLLAAKALEVASAGIVVGPVVLHLYSMALLIRLIVSRLPLGAKGRTQAREAWMLDLLFLLSAALCLSIVWVAYLRP
jgi:hypothetical protein